MRIIITALLSIVSAVLLSGCLAAALVGGGAAGIYADRHYEIEKKDSDSETSSTQSDSSE